MTKDHILPRRTGAGLVMLGGVRNWRWACLPCNNLREHAGDCPAVLAMARSVARDARMKVKHVLVAWEWIGSRSMRQHWRAQLARAAA